MKLIIQIPCYNEEATLGIALDALPRSLPGIDHLEWLVINDGSRDGTVEVARRRGVEHIVDMPRNRGLAKAFMAGVDACLRLGADIIVNTDADNQYRADDIPKLIEPILRGEAEIVIGARPIVQIPHFSPMKKLLQKLGSWVVRVASGTNVPDAPSGFRAMTRNAALRMQIFSQYTYTLEMIIQAGQKGIPLAWVPIRVNGELRPSRLVKSNLRYVWRSMYTIVRIFALYRPFRFFAYTGAVPFLIGCLLSARWLWLNIYEYPLSGRTHLPSLVVAATMLLVGVQMWILGLVADLLAANRIMLDEVRYFARTSELAARQPDDQPASRERTAT